MSFSKEVQAMDMASCVRLTAVTLAFRDRQVQFFAYLKHNERGEAVLPDHVLQKHLDRLGVRYGDTYTVG